MAGRRPASASWCWSARTPPRTARTWATRGRWRSCCRSSPPSTASCGCGCSYLQPAETRPGLVEAIATTPGVAPYFDLSFQHSSEPVLRRMRRFGSTERFLELLAARPRARPGGGRAQQLHRRLPRRDPRRRRRAGAVPDRGPARRDRRVRLQRRGRHRGGRPDRQGRARPRSSGGTTGSARSPRSCAPSGPRTGSARTVEVLVDTGRRRRASRAARRTRRPRSTARPPWSPAATASTWPRCAPATWSGPGSPAPRASTCRRAGRDDLRGPAGRWPRRPVVTGEPAPCRPRPPPVPAAQRGQRADRRCGSCWCRSSWRS